MCVTLVKIESESSSINIYSVLNFLLELFHIVCDLLQLSINFGQYLLNLNRFSYHVKVFRDKSNVFKLTLVQSYQAMKANNCNNCPLNWY